MRPEVPPKPASPRPKKSASPLLVVLGILGVLSVACCLGMSVLGWRASQSPKGKQLLGIIGQGVKVAEKSTNALGTAELRRAGCPQAAVIDLSDMNGLFMLFDAGVPKIELEGEPSVLVFCGGGLFDDLPKDCDALAEVYRNAAHPRSSYVVTIQKQQSQQPICKGTYEPEDVEGGTGDPR